MSIPRFPVANLTEVIEVRNLAPGATAIRLHLITFLGKPIAPRRIVPDGATRIVVTAVTDREIFFKHEAPLDAYPASANFFVELPREDVLNLCLDIVCGKEVV